MHICNWLTEWCRKTTCVYIIARKFNFIQIIVFGESVSININIYHERAKQKELKKKKNISEKIFLPWCLLKTYKSMFFPLQVMNFCNFMAHKVVNANSKSKFKKRVDESVENRPVHSCGFWAGWGINRSEKIAFLKQCLRSSLRYRILH